MAERLGDPFAPIVAALGQEGLHEDPPRVAQHGDEEMDDDGALADAHSLLPEVHLHLVPRRRLVPHGRQLQRAELPAPRRHDLLHHALGRGDTALA